MKGRMMMSGHGKSLGTKGAKEYSSKYDGSGGKKSALDRLKGMLGKGGCDSKHK